MLFLGDCLEQLKNIEDDSVDSIVTDPPYGLAFMGKKWDYDVPSVEIWKEVLRVLKPGGRYCITDMRRDVNPLLARLICAGTKPKEIRPGFWSSLNAAYTAAEMRGITDLSALNKAEIQADFFGLRVFGVLS